MDGLRAFLMLAVLFLDEVGTRNQCWVQLANVFLQKTERDLLIFLKAYYPEEEKIKYLGKKLVPMGTSVQVSTGRQVCLHSLALALDGVHGTKESVS
eukprot:1142139-Pelagomonas_calceolata.AAC.2